MSPATVLQLPVQTLPEIADPSLLEGMSPRRKAAVLVLALGVEESANVVAQLGQQELEELSTEIARMGEVTPELSAAVLTEFAEVMHDGGAPRGGLDAAQDMLRASVGYERAGEITERIMANFIAAPFSFLGHLDPRQTVSFLADEHPQTVALVMAHLPSGLASHILAGFGRDFQADVAHRIAVMDRTTPDLIRQVEVALERRLTSLGVKSDLSSEVGGLRPLVEIINRADRGTERMILEGLEQVDPALAERVRAQMFMFEDIVTLEDRAIQLVLRQVQAADLATALKGVADSVRAKVMQNMSERAALNLAEEIEVMGKVRLNVVEEAQAAVVRVIRQLEESGEILVGRGGDDAFVA